MITEKRKAYLRKYIKMWRKNNPEKVKIYLNNYRKKYPMKTLLLSIKSRVKRPSSCYHKKGIKALITYEELKTLWERDKGYLLEEPSIDRKDPNKDYVFENCQFIERSINSIKDRFLLKNGGWSKKYDKCIICGTTKIKHASKGLCGSCYNRKLWGRKLRKLERDVYD